MKLHKPAVIMTDVDGCFVSNENGKYNQAILRLLEENKEMISNCALITGRDMSGLSRFLGGPKFKNSTRDNLIANGLGRVEQEIKKVHNKEIVVCITNDIFEDENGNKKQPGNYYSSYKRIEEDILNEANTARALEKLNLYLDNLPKVESEALRNDAEKIKKYDRHSNNIFDIDSYDKGAQVKFYLESLVGSGADSVKIYIDDVPSNVVTVGKKNSEVIAVLNDVEMGK